MDTNLLQRFRHSLQEQRQNLTEWLANTPAWKKDIRLGPLSEKAAEAHLQVLDTAIEKADNRILGVCEVCHDYIEPARLEMDYTCCVCLDHLSAAERKHLEFELELATKIQQALLPQQVPEIPGVELAAYSRPAAIIGGDFFDFYRFQDGAYGLVIGDAVGHGISASLLISNLQASLRILVPDYDTPAAVVQRLNQLFYHNIRLTNFVTLFLAHFDPDTYRLTYSNAGHNPALLFRPRANGRKRLSWLQPTGAAIGLVEEFDFGMAAVTLAPGDVLLLYTDGITEAMNPQQEEFGQERLAELVQQGANWSAQELVQEIRDRLHDYSQDQPLADDTTIVAYKIMQP